MDRTFTQENSYKHRLTVTEEKVQKRKRLPGKLTLAFITQFAHVYYVERKLPAGLSGFVLN